MAYTDEVLKTNPSGYWPLTNDTTDVIKGLVPDSVGGTISYDTDVSPTGEPWFNFDGVTNYLRYVAPTLLKSSSFSVIAICRNKKPAPSGWSGLGTVTGRLNRSVSPYPGILLQWYMGNGTWDSTTVGGQISAYAADELPATLPTPIGQDYLVAFTGRPVTGGYVAMSLYLNGKVVSTKTSGSSFVTPLDSYPLFIGGRDEPTQMFKGNIQHLACYDRELSGMEIYNLATYAGYVFPPSYQKAPKPREVILESVYIATLNKVGKPREWIPSVPYDSTVDLYVGPGIVTGIVNVDHPPKMPIQRVVRLYSQNSGMLIKSTWADPVSGAYLFTKMRLNEPYYLVAHDYENTYNAVIQDNVYAGVP